MCFVSLGAEWASWRSTSPSRREVREIRRARVSLSDFRYEILSMIYCYLQSV